MGQRRLRVAMVSMHTNPFANPGTGDVGGMNVMVKHVALALSDQGHDVDVYTRRDDPAAPATHLHGRVRLHHLPAGPARPATKREQEGYVEEFSAQLRAAYGDAQAEGRAWSIIHSHHWFSGAAALPLAQELGIDHVQSFHSVAATRKGGWELGEQPEGPGRVPAEQMLAQRSEGIISVSSAEAATVLSLGAAEERVRVCAPGVDHEVFHPPSTAERAAPAMILAAARLEPLKGLELAIQAVAATRENHRPQLVISGAPTAGFEGYDSQLRSLARRCGVESHVTFVGPLGRKDLADMMRQASIMVIPSHSETYGLVALEAAACATPVIAAKAGGLVDAIDAPHTGVLLDSRDPNVWAQEIDRLLTHRYLLHQMGHRSHAWAQQFTWHSTARNWLESYAWFAGL